MFGRMTALDPHADMPLDERLRRAVRAWRERRGMSARRFGMEALGDPVFVWSQERGRSVRLRTADRVLVFMGLPPLGPAFRHEVETFLDVTGTKVAMLGEEAAGNPSFVGRLRRGASPRLTTVDRVRAWMAANANEEEAREIRARVGRGEILAGTAAPGSSDAPPPPCGDGVELEEEGGTCMNGNGSNYLNTREAAAWLSLSPRTLDRYRVSGDGPAFHRFGGRVRYLVADLEEWASARRRASTSDDGTALQGAAR